MLRESEGVLLYTSSETIILARIALTMALFSLIRSRGELILGISGGRKVISNWFLFFFFFSALSCDGSSLFSLMDACNLVNCQGSTLGGKKKGRRCPAGEKDVYEIEVGLHLQPALLPRGVFVELRRPTNFQ